MHNKIHVAGRLFWRSGVRLLSVRGFGALAGLSFVFIIFYFEIY